MKELLWFCIGGSICGPICIIATWLILRNNPRFLFRHYEHWLEKKVSELIDRGKEDIADKLNVAAKKLKKTMDDIT